MRFNYHARSRRLGVFRKRKAVKPHILLDEQTRRRIRRMRWRRAGIAAGVIVVVVSMAGLYLSPLFRVQSIEVAGATNLDPGHISQIAGLLDESMLRADTAAAEERIATLPLVRTVTVERDWPHAVKITLLEREPWGYWRTPTGAFVIDAEGMVLPDLPLPTDAPVITDLAGGDSLSPGERIDSGAVALARSLLEQVPAKLADGIRALEHSPDKGLALTTDSGYRVIVGDGQNMDYKLAVWQVVEKELGRQKMAGHVLDLRFEDRPSFQ